MDEVRGCGVELLQKKSRRICNAGADDPTVDVTAVEGTLGGTDDLVMVDGVASFHVSELLATLVRSSSLGASVVHSRHCVVYGLRVRFRSAEVPDSGEGNQSSMVLMASCCQPRYFGHLQHRRIRFKHSCDCKGIGLFGYIGGVFAACVLALEGCRWCSDGNSVGEMGSSTSVTPWLY